MRRVPSVTVVVPTVVVLVITLAGARVMASEPAASSSSTPAKKSAPASSASAPATAHTTPAKKDAPAAAPAVIPVTATATSAPVAPARKETLEEIVARVQKRLATEVPRGPKPAAAAPRPPVVERVTLVWRPSVVWPADLVGGEAPPAPAVDPNRVTLSWESQ